MSELSDMLIEGLLQREGECESSINWAGADYPCSGGAEFGGKKLDIGGMKLNEDVKIVVRVSIFPDGPGRPSEKQTLTYTSAPGAAPRRLRIDSVTPIYDAVLVLECNYVSKGA